MPSATPGHMHRNTRRSLTSFPSCYTSLSCPPCLQSFLRLFCLPRQCLTAFPSSVPYVALARVFSQIESISSRLKIVELLRDFFRQVIALSPGNLLPAIYLSVNKVPLRLLDRM